jgi:hypothetical protein
MKMLFLAQLTLVVRYCPRYSVCLSVCSHEISATTQPIELGFFLFASSWLADVQKLIFISAGSKEASGQLKECPFPYKILNIIGQKLSYFIFERRIFRRL